MNWDFSNAKISGSSIGPGARTYNGATDSPRAELHRQLDELRAAVEDGESGTHPAELTGMIDDLDAAVAAKEDAPALTGRWDRIRAALGPALQTSANVAQITSLIVQLVHG